VPSVTVSVATGLTGISAVYAGALLALGELKWFTVANTLGLCGLLSLSYLLTPVLGLESPALGRAALLFVVCLVYGFEDGSFRFD
jgi:O-antigen/teichoic acid export membrane protein